MASTAEREELLAIAKGLGVVTSWVGSMRRERINELIERLNKLAGDEPPAQTSTPPKETPTEPEPAPAPKPARKRAARKTTARS